jgi:hypothetical protein
LVILLNRRVIGDAAKNITGRKLVDRIDDCGVVVVATPIENGGNHVLIIVGIAGLNTTKIARWSNRKKAIPE